MAVKRVSSACPQSSDSDGVDGDKTPASELWLRRPGGVVYQTRPEIVA